MHLKLKPKIDSADELDISLYNPLFYDKFLDKEKYLIPVKDFELRCSELSS